MPSIIIEDGSVVSNANSYVGVDEFQSYLQNRGLSFAATSGSYDQVLVLAMDYLEAQDFIGSKSTKDQPLQWPRDNVVIDGHYYESTEIPNVLKKAQMEIAISIDEGNGPNSPVGRETKREKVGDIEVEYMDDASESVELPAVKNILRKIAVVRNSKVSTTFVSRV